MNDVVEVLRSNRERAIDDLVASVVELIPRYALSDPGHVRRNVEHLFELVLQVIETGDTGQLMAALGAISDDRVAQGFSPADFLKAFMTMYPVVRNVVRQAGPRNDAVFAHMFEQIERGIFTVIATASSIYTTSLTRSVEARAEGLEREAAGLFERERALSDELEQRRRALQAAQQLNSRVIESLSSGVMVAEFGTTNIVLWSRRMAEITGIPERAAVGKKAGEVLAGLKDVPMAEIMATIKATERLPLTRVSFQADGAKRSVYVRGERLRSESREVTGAVVIVDDITERELLIDSFSRYVSREVVQRLLSRSGRTHKLDGERKTCTVLFADIRGFTGLSERVSLEQLHEVLNEYFRLMIDHVSAHDGVIDKFIGDKIMAVFSGGDGSGAISACRAAVQIRDAITALNQQRLASDGEPIEVGIGVNTGEVVMGTVGSEERMSFTVIGDSVNVADRLQSIAAAGEVIVGSRTRALIENTFELEALGDRQLKGRVAHETVFKLLGYKL